MRVSMMTVIFLVLVGAAGCRQGEAQPALAASASTFAPASAAPAPPNATNRQRDGKVHAEAR